MPIARVLLALALLAAVLLLVAGPGARFGVWDFRSGFDLLRWASYAGIAAAAVALVLLAVPRVRRRGTFALLAAVVIGAGVALVPWSFKRQATAVPPIHDISTDTQRPPAFVAIAPLRADAPNPVDYGGEEIAQQQRAAYPDLQTRRLDAPPAQAFERALAAARAQGWEIVATDPAAGRIEATDTTFWFGFKDDVVIRIEPDGAGSRLDVRSKSRVGKSDVGANAARIRAFLAVLDG